MSEIKAEKSFMLNKIIFLTGSRTKLAHLRYLAKDLPITIESFHEASYHANYEEPRIFNREQLLNESLESAIEQVNRTGLSSNKVLFLIEDTSVIINALSSPKKEVPGLDVKYWMKEITFQELDKKLIKANDHAVSVRSDMILFNIDKTICEHFTGTSMGSIVGKEFNFDTQLLYPWLDNKTFNKWFIPEGESKPISMLSIIKANKGDFRKKAFFDLTHYLNKKELLCIQKPIWQLDLLRARLFIIVGYSCAGKTTIAQYGDKKYNFIHIEASDFMKLCFYERHGIESHLSLEKFALIALEQQPEIVAERIINEMSSYPHQMDIIITGFRSPKEAEHLISKLKDLYLISIIKVQASFEHRLDRAIKRKRSDEATSARELEKKDSTQCKMGLEEFNCQILSNNSSVVDLYNQFDNLVDEGEINNFPNRLIFKMGGLKTEVMSFLAKEYNKQGHGQYFSTTELSKKITNHKDNISRFFNQRYSVDFEVKYFNDVKKYRLSNTGYSKIRHAILKDHINIQ